MIVNTICHFDGVPVQTEPFLIDLCDMHRAISVVLFYRKNTSANPLLGPADVYVARRILQCASFPGGLEGIRTLDPHNANVVRSQLRYKPISCG